MLISPFRKKILYCNVCIRGLLPLPSRSFPSIFLLPQLPVYHLGFYSIAPLLFSILEWKKVNVVLVHKRGDKQCLNDYRTVSLLPICGKILERLIFNEMFRFSIENNLISSNQSGFKPGDSCINQLLSVTHEIYKSFDDGFEVRGVFPDISKAFNKFGTRVLSSN